MAARPAVRETVCSNSPGSRARFLFASRGAIAGRGGAADANCAFNSQRSCEALCLGATRRTPALQRRRRRARPATSSDASRRQLGNQIYLDRAQRLLCKICPRRAPARGPVNLKTPSLCQSAARCRLRPQAAAALPMRGRAARASRPALQARSESIRRPAQPLHDFGDFPRATRRSLSALRQIRSHRAHARRVQAN